MTTPQWITDAAREIAASPTHVQWLMTGIITRHHAAAHGWRPIESAPRDKRILLGYANPVFTGVYAICGQWNDEQNTQKKRGYWEHELRFAGVTAMRRNPPTHWQPLPPTPDAKGG